MSGRVYSPKKRSLTLPQYSSTPFFICTFPMFATFLVVINPLLHAVLCPRISGWMDLAALPYHLCDFFFFFFFLVNEKLLLGPITQRVIRAVGFILNRKRKCSRCLFWMQVSAYGGIGGPAGCDAHCYSATRYRASHWGMPLSHTASGFWMGRENAPGVLSRWLLIIQKSHLYLPNTALA